MFLKEINMMKDKIRFKVLEEKTSISASEWMRKYKSFDVRPEKNSSEENGIEL